MEQRMPKQAKVAVETEVHEDGGHTHTLTYTNGHKRIISFGPSHELAAQFYATGTKTKLLAAANSEDDADAAVKKVDKLVDAFDEGKWSLVGDGGPKHTPLVRAYAELAGVDLEKAEATIKGLTKSAQAKLRSTPRISAIISRLKSEEGEADGDSLLNNLLAPSFAGDEAQGDESREANGTEG
jgi:hypothetical protein